MATTSYKELRYNENISKIKSVQFSLLSPDEIINQSTCEIEKHQLYMSSSDGNQIPFPGGLYDQRMGVIDRGLICNTCEQTSNFCPGHFGHIILAQPIFHMHFISKTIKLLRCICFRCSNLLWKNIYDLNMFTDSSEKFDYIYEECKKIKECDKCGCVQPTRYQKEGVGKLFAEFKHVKSNETKKVQIRASYVLKIFKRITIEDIDILGFNNLYCKPEWLICTVLPVPPPSVRPSVRQDNNQRSDDDLTYKLIDIVKINNKLKDYQSTLNNDDMTKPDHQKFIDDHTSLIQYHAATLINNESPFGSGVPQANVQRSGRTLKSLTQRIKSKEGRIRGNLMGKRVDFSARSVITPDPLLGIDELGVPIKIAQTLTFPEKVTKFNINRLRKHIKNGYDNYPGAKSVVIYKNSYDTNPNIKNLKHIDLDEIIKTIKIGDIVNRHLIDGDIVLFNRQPSLHKMSMMGHKVRVMKADTFRLNVCVTSPYNADFDGDEMNMHVPQSLQTVSELKHLAMVSSQIISPQVNTPVIGLVQDALLGSNRITIKNKKIENYNLTSGEEGLKDYNSEFILNERQFNNLMMFNDNFNGCRMKETEPEYYNIGEPIKFNNKNYWKGQQIFTSLLPSLSLINSEISIINGKLINTEVGKDNQQKGLVKKHLGTAAGGLVHVIFNDLGEEETTKYLNNNQRVINNFVFMTGFSVGVSDLIAENKTKQEIKEIIESKKKNVEQITYNIRNNLIERKYEKTLQLEFETLVNAELNQANDHAGTKAVNSLNPISNNIVNMIKCGSKGNIINLGQMIACLGQQNIDGKRIPYHYKNRTLPHFTQYDYSPESRGFIESNYYVGLNPVEYYFHAMTGREGIIDTAVKTSETGYVQRKLIKSMEDVKICYDNTVRNHNDDIIQFLFGEDNIESSKLEKQNFNLLKCDLDDFNKYYKIENLDSLKTYERFLLNTEQLNEQLLQQFQTKYITLLQNRQFVVNDIYSIFEDIYFPMNFNRIIVNTLVKHNIYKQKYKSDIIIDELFKKIEELENKIYNYYDNHVLNIEDESKKYNPGSIFSILINTYLSPYNIIINHNCNNKVLDEIISDIEFRFYRSIINPGENVGTITAQSIGEPATQMTLNTFHYAGVSSKSNVTRGVPRLKELLSVSKNIKNPSLTIYLDKDISITDNIDEIMDVKNKLIDTKVKDIIERTRIIFKSNLVENKNEEFCKLLNLETKEKSIEPFVLELHFSKKKMVEKGIDLIQILIKIYEQYSDDLLCEIYTSDNINKIIISSRYNDDYYEDNVCVLKLLEKDILDIKLIGVTNITNINFRQISNQTCDTNGVISTKKEVVLDSDGSNLLDILINSDIDIIDRYKCISNDIQEVYSVLGVEAARTILINEFVDVISSAGASINHRHIQLLADTMTFSGGLMSIDRFGINKSNYGPLAKASFEEVTDQLFKSSMFGEIDNCKGISSNVMFGQEGYSGTGICDLLLDEDHYFADDDEIEKNKVDICSYINVNNNTTLENNIFEDIECEL